MWVPGIDTKALWRAIVCGLLVAGSLSSPSRFVPPAPPLPLFHVALAGRSPLYDAKVAAESQAWLQAELRRVLAPDTRFSGPFEDAINQMRSACRRVDFAVDWRGLKAAGVDLNAPVSVDAGRRRVADAIADLLTQGGRGPAGPVELGYSGSGGRAQIATADGFKHYETRGYVVRDLLPPPPDAAPFPDTRPDWRKRADAAAAANYAAAKAALLADVRASDPNGWRGNAGFTAYGSSLRLRGCVLTVAQTPEVHERIAERLGDRRQINRVKAAGIRAVVLLAAFVSVVLLVGRSCRGRRRQRRGLCRRCGYDLRATPDRCPECGEVRTRGTATAVSA